MEEDRVEYLEGVPRVLLADDFAVAPTRVRGESRLLKRARGAIRDP
jgi:hypothetical protein